MNEENTFRLYYCSFEYNYVFCTTRLLRMDIARPKTTRGKIA
jgi:hypothetical protein